MYLQKLIRKKNLFFVGFLEVTDEKSRIRSWNWIRTKMLWIRKTGSKRLIVFFIIFLIFTYPEMAPKKQRNLVQGRFCWRAGDGQDINFSDTIRRVFFSFFKFWFYTWIRFRIRIDAKSGSGSVLHFWFSHLPCWYRYLVFEIVEGFV